MYLTYSCTLSGVTGTFDPPGISSTSKGSATGPDNGAWERKLTNKAINVNITSQAALVAQSVSAFGC